MRIQKIIRKIKYRRYMHLFRDAKSIYAYSTTTLTSESAIDIELIRRDIRRYAVSRAYLRLKTSRVIDLASSIIMAICLVSIGLIAYGISNEIHYTLPNDNSKFNFTLLIAGSGVLIGVMAGVGLSLVMVRFESISLSTQAWILLAIALIFTGVFMVILNQDTTNYWPLIPYISHSNVRDLIAAGILALAAGIAVAGVVVVGGLILTLTVVVNRMEARSPEIMITYTLINLLHDLRSRPMRFASVRFKAYVCGSLRDVSIYLQYAIPRVMKISDPSVNETVKEQLKRSAMYLREMQLWIVLANEKTLNEVRDVIASYVTAIALGQYDMLPKNASSDRRSNKVRGIVMLIRTFAVAIIPIGCIIGVRYAGLSLSAQFTGWAVIIAITWAAITLIATLDPLYKTRLSDIQSLISLVRGKDG